jgi:hypothetical protein
VDERAVGGGADGVGPEHSRSPSLDDQRSFLSRSAKEHFGKISAVKAQGGYPNPSRSRFLRFDSSAFPFLIEEIKHSGRIFEKLNLISLPHDNAIIPKKSPCNPWRSLHIDFGRKREIHIRDNHRFFFLVCLLPLVPELLLESIRFGIVRVQEISNDFSQFLIHNPGLGQHHGGGLWKSERKGTRSM